MKQLMMLIILSIPFLGISQKMPFDGMLLECQGNNLRFDMTFMSSGEITKMSTEEIDLKIKNSNSTSIKNNAELFKALYDDKAFKPLKASGNTIIGEYTSETKLND